MVAISSSSSARVVLFLLTFMQLTSLLFVTNAHKNDEVVVVTIPDVVRDDTPAAEVTDASLVVNNGASSDTTNDKIEGNDARWWYYNIQESHIEKLVHEYRGGQHNHRSNNHTNIAPVEHNIFTVLQQQQSGGSAATTATSSMVVQFYSSDDTDCPVECMNLRDHYLQLAMHVIDIITTPPPPPPPLQGIVTNDNANDTTNIHGNSSVSFHVINCAMHAALCQHNQIAHYPTVRLYKYVDDESATSSFTSYKSNNAVIDISYQHIHPYEVLEKLGITGYELPDGDIDDDDDEQGSASVTSNLQEIDNVPSTATAGKSFRHRSRKEMFDDIHIALDYTLRNVIFSTSKNTEHVVHIPHTKHRSDLTITEQEVLKSFLMLLQKTLPASTDDTRLRDMIKAVIDNFIYAMKNHHYMDAIINEYRPTSTQYSIHTCPTGNNDPNNNNQTQYICAMWDVLLMMSVGMSDFNIQSYDATEMIHPASALHTMYEYVEIFGFSATASSNMDTTNAYAIQKQFQEIYNDCTFMNRCQQLRDAPKIIYEDSIDKVSKEYIAQITTTYSEWRIVPLYIAAVRNITLQQSDAPVLQIWPPTKLCKVCWKDASSNSNFVHDATNMYKYLKVEYGHIDAITATYRHELLHENILKDQRDESSAIETNKIHSRPTPVVDEERTEEVSNLKIKWNARPRSSSMSISMLRHGSICMLFLLATLLRWLYIRYSDTKLLLGTELDNSSQRTIMNNFDSDESDHYGSPSQRTALSPKKRQLLNRRLMAEKEKDKVRATLLKTSSFELDHLEAPTTISVKQMSTIDLLSIPGTPPPPLYKCENSTAIYNNTNMTNNMDGIQQLRQRKSPLVSLTKPKILLQR